MTPETIRILYSGEANAEIEAALREALAPFGFNGCDTGTFCSEFRTLSERDLEFYKEDRRIVSGPITTNPPEWAFKRMRK